MPRDKVIIARRSRLILAAGGTSASSQAGGSHLSQAAAAVTAQHRNVLPHQKVFAIATSNICYQRPRRQLIYELPYLQRKLIKWGTAAVFGDARFPDVADDDKSDVGLDTAVSDVHCSIKLDGCEPGEVVPGICDLRAMRIRLRLKLRKITVRMARRQLIDAASLLRLGDEDLSEGEGCAAGGTGQQVALHGVCLAVGDVVVPAVAGRASHDEQGARW
ncbi:MAG: hypothetical protein FRX49_00206 [Trebouxia sp. A1-2]|nr:MAG: hypothetical protein FRX49_00206 [Trebouxia sp. A1-2]